MQWKAIIQDRQAGVIESFPSIPSIATGVVCREQTDKWHLISWTLALLLPVGVGLMALAFAVGWANCNQSQNKTKAAQRRVYVTRALLCNFSASRIRIRHVGRPVISGLLLLCQIVCVFVNVGIQTLTTCYWQTRAARIILVPSLCLHITSKQFYLCMCVCVCQINENLLWQPQRTQKERVKAPHSALGTQEATATQMRWALICAHVEGWDVTKFYSFNVEKFVQVKKKSHTYRKTCTLACRSLPSCCEGRLS